MTLFILNGAIHEVELKYRTKDERKTNVSILMHDMHTLECYFFYV